MNYLQRTTLFIVFAGLFLLLPSAWVSSEDLIHVVGKGDTVYSISRFFNVTADELMKANNISDPSKLHVGAKLVIPVNSDNLPNSQTPPVADRPLTNYRVVKGDTLFSIARNNGITLAKLQEINKFSQNHVIKIGDVIKVPGNATQTATAAPAATTATATATSASKNVAASVYSLRWPVNPKEITYMTGQMGVVIEGDVNEAVKSIIEGNVISAGPWRKFGRVVIVESKGGYFYMYGGCESLTVNVGDKVAPGTEVGKLGINAVSQKPELFFMVFKNDIPIDPAKAPRAATTAGSNGRT